VQIPDRVWREVADLARELGIDAEAYLAGTRS
jgi:hypothetical protein